MKKREREGYKLKELLSGLGEDQARFFGIREG
jgi:hypothetical protein